MTVVNHSATHGWELLIIEPIEVLGYVSSDEGVDFVYRSLELVEFFGFLILCFARGFICTTKS